MIIFYGVCGEGMGHAARSFGVAECLMNRGHEVHVFTSNEGYQLFDTSGYPKSNLHEIKGLRFGMNKNGVSNIKTVINFLKFSKTFKNQKAYVVNKAKQLKPDLIISDFEPIVASTARKLKIPFITIDNQHKFLAELGDEFKKSLQLYNKVAGIFIRLYIGKANRHLVTTFHHFPPTRNLQRVNIILRDEIKKCHHAGQTHLLVYLKPNMCSKVIPVLERINEKCIVYGCKKQDTEKIKYYDISYKEFIENLATCKGVICGAGNQLIGEAKYFGKKVLAIPLDNQQEQYVNARYIELEGLGHTCLLKNFEEASVLRFLNTDFNITPDPDGLEEIVDFIERGRYV